MASFWGDFDAHGGRGEGGERGIAQLRNWLSRIPTQRSYEQKILFFLEGWGGERIWKENKFKKKG